MKLNSRTFSTQPEMIAFIEGLRVAAPEDVLVLTRYRTKDENWRVIFSYTTEGCLEENAKIVQLVATDLDLAPHSGFRTLSQYLSIKPSELAEALIRYWEPGYGVNSELEACQALLREFAQAVAVTGGVYRESDGVYKPLADPEWTDLGSLYLRVCEHLSETVSDATEEEYPDGTS